MITSVENYPIKYDFNQLREFKQNMPILKNNYGKTNNDDENVNRVPIVLETIPEHASTTPTLRSILRKHVVKEVSTNTSSNNVQQTSILTNDNDERDSDYTGDEDNDDDDEEEEEEGEEENKGGKKSEQYYRNSSSHQQQKDHFFPTFFVFPLETSKSRLETTVRTQNDLSSNRNACVTFANNPPSIIRQSSSPPPSTGSNIEPLPSVTYLNMKEDLQTITTTTTTMTSDFRPVYVSPLKYRPLLGLSANDSRLLLEKRVSLLGKPVVFHPTQKRSPTYRRTQLHIYNFLERAHGYKAIIYHTFV
jgi:hypothetical protein